MDAVDDQADRPATTALIDALGDEPGAVRTRVLERTRRWVEQESPSGDAERATALAARIVDELTGSCGSVETVDAAEWGCHVLAKAGATDGDREPVLVLGHLDTVHPVGSLAERPFRVADGRALGPGVFDMKAPLAVLAEALACCGGERAPVRPVHVLITCDEERGSPASRSLIEELAREAAAALVLEPPLPGGRVKTARKGVGIYTMRAIGRAAHAGLEPELGISAIDELAHQILRIGDLADPDLGTTLNAGIVHGGTASNVIADEAVAEIDVRYATPAEGARVDAGLRSLEPVLEGAELRIEGGDNRPPLVRTPEVVRLYEHARTIGQRLGLELGEGAAGGGSDGCFTGALGVPTLDGLGVDGGGAHRPDEHVLVADLPRRVALLTRLLQTL